MEFDPVSKTRKVVRSPVVAIRRGPGGVIIFVSPDRKVYRLVLNFGELHYFICLSMNRIKIFLDSMKCFDNCRP